MDVMLSIIYDFSQFQLTFLVEKFSQDSDVDLAPWTFDISRSEQK